MGGIEQSGGYERSGQGILDVLMKYRHGPGGSLSEPVVDTLLSNQVPNLSAIYPIRVSNPLSIITSIQCTCNELLNNNRSARAQVSLTILHARRTVSNPI